jgi:hypothetical protein
MYTPQTPSEDQYSMLMTIASALLDPLQIAVGVACGVGWWAWKARSGFAGVSECTTCGQTTLQPNGFVSFLSWHVLEAASSGDGQVRCFSVETREEARGLMNTLTGRRILVQVGKDCTCSLYGERVPWREVKTQGAPFTLDTTIRRHLRFLLAFEKDGQPCNEAKDVQSLTHPVRPAPVRQLQAMRVRTYRNAEKHR